MKFNFSNKGRTAAYIVAAAVIFAGCAGTIAFAASGMDAVPKGVLISETGTGDAVQENNLAQAILDSQGTIEYRKTVHTITEKDKFSDEKSFVSESWLDPKTLENREDCKILSGENETTDFHSTYIQNNGSDAITVQRDLQGNAVSGTITKLSEGGANKNFLAVTQYRSFAGIKEGLAVSAWKDEGVEKTSDGKEIKKLSQTYMNSNPENEQVKTNLVCYVDTATGFPVREELYQDVNGTMELIWYETYEYKYVNNDGKLFDFSGVELKELPVYSK